MCILINCLAINATKRIRLYKRLTPNKYLAKQRRETTHSHHRHGVLLLSADLDCGVKRPLASWTEEKKQLLCVKFCSIYIRIKHPAKWIKVMKGQADAENFDWKKKSPKSIPKWMLTITVDSLQRCESQLFSFAIESDGFRDWKESLSNNTSHTDLLSVSLPVARPPPICSAQRSGEEDW